MHEKKVWALQDEPLDGMMVMCGVEPESRRFTGPVLKKGDRLKIDYTLTTGFEIRSGDEILPIYIDSAEGLLMIEHHNVFLTQVTITRKTGDNEVVSMEIDSLPFSVFEDDIISVLDPIPRQTGDTNK